MYFFVGPKFRFADKIRSLISVYAPHYNNMCVPDGQYSGHVWLRKRTENFKPTSKTVYVPWKPKYCIGQHP